MTNSGPMQNPPGNPEKDIRTRRSDTKPALREDLLSAVVEPENMRLAWQQVRANKGAAGVDQMTIEQFPPFAESHWPAIRQALLDGRYQPSPVRQRMIPKPNGGQRMLGIPTVIDRVIQQAIAQVLTPIFDPGFSESSFGFRPGRSAQGAVKQVRQFIREGQRYVVDLDLAKYFDTVNHDVLMSRLSRKVDDKRLLRLIGRYLRAGVEVDGTVQPTSQGVPQGGPLSPLMGNVVLDAFDKELEKRGHRFARYADDLVILVGSERAGRRVMASVTRYLHRRLKLVVNEAKSQVVRFDQCEFLGFTFRGKQPRIYWTNRALADFKHRVRRLTNRNWGVSMRRRLAELGRYVRGWMNYFGLSEYYRPVPTLDQWLRRRVRMCYWKQWKRPRTRIRRLRKLGTSFDHALKTALSRKSAWHLARTMATQTGMTNAWLATEGLVSIRDLWIARAPLR